MENKNITYEPYAHIIVKLLNGIVYDENEELWNDLLHYQIEITQFFEKIAIELIVDKKDGYAYLKQIEIDEKGNTIGLIRRISLKYEVSLICVFLREMLDEFEINNVDQRNLYITHKQLKDNIELFFKEKGNKVKWLSKFDTHIDSIVKLGFLKEISSDNKSKDETRYEVKRIIKAKITNDVLEEFKRKLEQNV
ncbi:MAG: DUF4194 domain-containing protein [Prevotellaceae bacterium]|jgi:hypothetical protein|nr:DUF4194 domain-containing protein [Prevotellaceae bacterium]